MPVIYKKAPGKIILFGEHAVVYGKPAIAIPVKNVSATARIMPEISLKQGNIQIQARDIDLDAAYSELNDDHPLAAAIRLTLQKISPVHIPSFTIQISSTVPISAGLGSGAAVSVALIRVLSTYLGSPLPTEEVSTLAYEIEKIHHGTPSGIDNTVIAYEKPVYFQRGKPIQMLQVKSPTHWVIADSGEKTPTHETVSEVREKRRAHPDKYDAIFQQIGDIAQRAKSALIQGDIMALGQLMNENQSLLEKLDVSSSTLNTLIASARSAGASGAKLSGGGRGGNIIALAPVSNTSHLEQALINAGAKHIIKTTLSEVLDR